MCLRLLFLVGGFFLFFVMFVFFCFFVFGDFLFYFPFVFCLKKNRAYGRVAVIARSKAHSRRPAQTTRPTTFTSSAKPFVVLVLRVHRFDVTMIC